MKTTTTMMMKTTRMSSFERPMDPDPSPCPVEPDVDTDREAPGSPGKPKKDPLPIADIKKVEDDAKGG